VSTRSATLRVLLVEDSEEDAELVLRALRDGGLSIEAQVVATEAGMRSALATRLDIVICDWSLPGFSGARVLAIAHELASRVPYILLSGTLGENLVVEALRYGASAYVPKSRLKALVPAVHRALADARMRRERDRMATTVEQSPNGIVIVEADLRIAYANPVYATSVGMEPAELVGRSAAEVMSIGLDAGTVTAIARSVGSEQPWCGEVDHRNPDGTVMHLEVSISPLREANGQISGWLGAIRDVTQLRESQERFRTLIESANDAIFIWDRDGRCLEANRKACERLGYSHSELLTMTAAEISAPDQATRVEDRMAAIEQGGSAFVETVHMARDGTLIPTEVSTTVTNLGGRTVFLSIARDITERKRAVDALAASEARLRIAIDTMLDGVLISTAIRDASGRIADFRLDYANPAMAAISRIPEDQQVGHTLLELFPAYRTNGLFDAYVRVVETGAPFESSAFRYVDPDAPGGPADQYLEQRVARIGDGYLISERDVTDRHRAELEMRRLSTAIEQSADAVVVTDADARITYVNPAFEKVSGYAREEVLGQNPRILQSGVQSPAFYGAMWAALSSGRTFVGDLTNRRKDGSLFQEEAVISPVRDADGTTTSYVAVKRDVTRERATEAAQERIARERVRIASALADVQAGPTSEETSARICRQVVGLAGLVAAALYCFALDGQAMPLAFVRADGEPAPLLPLPAGRSKHLRERAADGPWVEAWVHRPWHPYERLFRETGVRAVACAPVRHGGQLIGLLIVSSAAANATSQLTESLPALLEFATVAGALVGPAIVDLTEVGSVRHRILKTIGEGAFHPVFQPIVDLASRETVGYEALTRFDSGQRPDLCFADAWSVDMGPALELATLGAAVAAARQLPAGLWLSLNVSPRLLVDPDRLNAALWPSDRPIVLEITEHEIIKDYEAVRAAIRALGHDVRLAVDDAGAGIANFGHIIELRPNIVKLDIGLVRGVNADLGRQAMVVGMRHFAAETGCRLLAEGVETGAEADTVCALGVDLGQGYFFGHPERVEAWAVAGKAGEARDRRPVLER
jgi:PAS domain S-box-containing protein